ncbi:MAG: zinc-binding dehydrogenase, partial [Erysipelotrichaceae bacterium]
EEGCFLMMCWIAMNGILPVNVKMGSKVGIFGLGNLGLILSLLYKAANCEVYAIDPVSSRGERARKMGIDHVIDAPIHAQKQAIQEATNHHGFDIVIDASGVSGCIASCIDSAADFAQVVLLGSPRVAHEMDVTPVFNQIHMKMLQVIGAMNRRYPFFPETGSNESMIKYLAVLEKMLNDKVIDVSHFVSHRIKPEEMLSAYDGLMNDKEHYLGVMIDWQS